MGEELRVASAEMASLIGAFSVELQVKLNAVREAERDVAQQKAELARRTAELNQREQALNARESRLRETEHGLRQSVSAAMPAAPSNQPRPPAAKAVNHVDLQILARATAAALHARAY
jgi:chromosome segregation ATPase